MTPWNSRRAGTLIEVLIATMILIVAIVAIAGTMLMSQKASRLSRDRLIATNLAVEGIEIIRNIRDTNWVRFSSDRQNCWMEVMSAPTCNSIDSYEEVASDPLKNFSTNFNVNSFIWTLGSTNTDLRTSQLSPFFQLNQVTVNDRGTPGNTSDDLTIFAGDVGTASRFFRQIDINPIIPLEEIQVISTVQWYDSGGTVQDVEIIEHIYNW